MAQARRLQLSEKIHVIKNYYQNNSYKYVIDDWNTTFPTPAPSKSTMFDLIKKFEVTGSVLEAPKSGRQRCVRTEENTDLVATAFVHSPTKSQRRASAEMGISRRSLSRIMTDLGLKPYRPRRLHALNEDDGDRRIQFCEIFLSYYEEDPEILDKIIWTDEACFKLNGRVNRHNSVYWSESNPHEIIETEVNLPGLTVWGGICSAGLIGPFFFRETVNSDRYLTMLKEQFIPAIIHMNKDTMFFQQDGAPPHYGLKVRQWLDSEFPGRWLGRRGPIEWPARSPDLTPPDFFLWGVLKDKVYAQKPRTLQQLQIAIENEWQLITPQLCQKVTHSVIHRLEDCIKAEGRQFEHFYN